MRIRRAVAVGALAVGLALVPSAAMGYGASDYTNLGTASTTTPLVGVPFTITVVGPPNTPVVLTVTTNPASIPDAAITIAGTKALTKTTDASGVVSFTITLSEPGTYTAIVSDGVSNDVLSTQVFVVPGPTPGAAGGSGSGASGSGAAAATGRGMLSSTGAEALPLALGAGALVVAGAGVAVYATRRRRASHA